MKEISDWISDSPIDYLSDNWIFARFTREGMGGADFGPLVHGSYFVQF